MSTAENEGFKKYLGGIIGRPIKNVHDRVVEYRLGQEAEELLDSKQHRYQFIYVISNEDGNPIRVRENKKEYELVPGSVVIRDTARTTQSEIKEDRFSTSKIYVIEFD